MSTIKWNRIFTGILGTAMALLSCVTEQEEPRFVVCTENETGLKFRNVLSQSEDFNVFNYMYFFNGGGLAAGDFNQDGLDDLFFTSNMGTNGLFINQGNLQFQDVTEMAGVSGQEGWTTGVTTVDLNSDGLLDLYVSQVGDYEILLGKNQLYINQGVRDGVPFFKDQAKEYGLDLIGFATQAVFFDYDLDGDLDMYQLNHSLHQNGTFGRRQDFEMIKHPTAGDKLMRNDNTHFTEVTEEAGIKSTVLGYGLGIVVSDINLDGWPDLYIGNDFHENDYLYINQQDGTFRDESTQQLDHTSRFSMGVDAADINQDGFPEIISLDMLPEDPYILKSSLGEDGYNIFQFKLGYGYAHQYARNNLQFNNRNGSFSEIGLFGEVYATDWSWAPLLIDLNHDGFRDLFVSNGIPRRMNDIDYINFKLSDADVMWKTESGQVQEDDLSLVEMMPQIKLQNVIFTNSGDLKFKRVEEVQNNLATYSNGAVYSDLDLDGDLDIVVNNLDDAPLIYQNLQMDNHPSGDYIQISLTGSPDNIQAIGAKVILKGEGKLIVQEHFPARGYQSSVTNIIHMGIGDRNWIDQSLVVWPDQSYSAFDIKQAHEFNLSWIEGLPVYDYTQLHPEKDHSIIVEDKTAQLEISFRHKENPFVEFNRERLIPHMVSAEGPAIAIGDVNGDGLEDLFLGNAKESPSRLYHQTAHGTFVEHTPDAWERDAIYEDVDAQFFDIDNDGDLDLFVAAGGNEFRGQAPALTQRYYLNLSNGEWSQAKTIDSLYMTASCIRAHDLDGDGYKDVFLGGRSISRKYGLPPKSYLLRNNQNGGFEDFTAVWSSGLSQVGMVKTGHWVDLDGDQDQDLILALEWDEIAVFVNEEGFLTKKYLPSGKGWWNTVYPFDADGDGDLDLLCGNTGENSRLKPSIQYPVKMYVNDFDDNEQTEQVLTYYVNGAEIPFANHAEIVSQLNHLKKKYLYAKDFAKASLQDLFGREKLSSAITYSVDEFSHIWLENQGDMGFVKHKLPADLQWSTLNAIAFVRRDQGETQLLVGGNFYENNIEMGRYDANKGNLLCFTNDEVYTQPLSIQIKGQVRSIMPMSVGNSTVFVLGKNDSELKIIEIAEGSSLL